MMRMRRMVDKPDSLKLAEIKELIINYAEIDGEHHKQWLLAQIGGIVDVDLIDKGIAP